MYCCVLAVVHFGQECEGFCRKWLYWIYI